MPLLCVMPLAVANVFLSAFVNHMKSLTMEYNLLRDVTVAVIDNIYFRAW